MVNENDFDILLSSKQFVSRPVIHNIAELIFTPLPHRNENSLVSLSHVNENYVEVSLQKLRCITSKLYQEFEEKGIKPGDTVLLTTLSVNNNLYIILLFTALISYGARVLFPMFVETTALDTWIHQTKCSVVIFPEKEIQALRGYDRQKQVIQEIRDISQNNRLSLYDVSEDFHIKTYLDSPRTEAHSYDIILVQRCISNTGFTTESVIFTTSGTSGKSKLVLYEQGAFLRNCQCWQESGMYRKEKLGGRNFIDILPHTVSARAICNALWTGYPICFVNTEWIKHKPQKILPFLVKMKPEVMTLGPASFNVLLELLKLVPEVKELAFSELRTVVSTGAPYSKKTAEEIKDRLGLYLHNAYGTTETQQVLTTLLCEPHELDQQAAGLGKPFTGVTLGLQKFDENLYRLYVRTPYGHKSIIDNQIIHAEEFFDTGDIVRQGNNKVLTFIGRESKDFIKSGYGAKVPLSYLQDYYKELYEQVRHIEYYAFETYDFSLGIAALLFIQDKHLPKGRVRDRKTIKKYYNHIKTINSHLVRTLEPFEYEQRAITRFLLINNDVHHIWKGTIYGSAIATQYKDEIYDLLHSNNPKTGVQNLVYLESNFLKFLLRYTPLRFKKPRRVILKMLLGRKKGSIADAIEKSEKR